MYYEAQFNDDLILMSRLNFSAPKYITSGLMMRLTMVSRTYSSRYSRL